MTHSPLWHACKVGNLDMVKFLIGENDELVAQNSPEGTSPHFVAFVKEHFHVLEYLMYTGPYNETHSRGNSETLLKKLTKNYPIYRDEKKELKLKRQCKSITIEEINALAELFEGDVCPVKARKMENPDNNIYYVSDFNFNLNSYLKCVDDCRQ